MSRLRVELLPKTLAQKSSIGKDEIKPISTSGLALIDELHIDRPTSKTLGIELADYINSWCRVHLNIHNADAEPEEENPHTRATLYHHADGNGVVMEEYVDGGFSLIVRLDDNNYQAITDTVNNPRLRVVIECNVWGRNPVESTNLSEEPGTWRVNFDSIEVSIAEVQQERWPLAGLVGRKVAEFDKTVSKKDRPPKRADSSHYFAKSIGSWAISNPVSRSAINAELDDAFDLTRSFLECPAHELEDEIIRYVQKPWATSGYVERRLTQFLVSERVNELVEDVKASRPTLDVTAMMRHYQLAEGEVAPKKNQWVLELSIALVFGCVVGFGAGWAIGLAAGFLYMSICDIKNRSERALFPKHGDGPGVMIKDLELIKSIFWRAEDNAMCPRYIRQRLEEMESRGVSWYGGTLALVHHAEARNPNVWQ